ncbi:MAG: flagellar basal body P-ring protein FlgI, partial [Pseudomonadota bacterium]
MHHWNFRDWVLRLAPALIAAVALTGADVAQAERVRDLASVSGVRTNQLVGYGLVVGLDGTGDQTAQTPFTVQSLQNMLNQFGITIPEGVNPLLTNVAAVSVHAELPPFSKPGQTIDVTISSIGNSKSLRGGSLLMTPLRGIDGNVYAVAQGNLVVGGFGGEGLDGSRITVNIPSAGRIPNGATVERAVAAGFNDTDFVVLNLNTPDFTTANRLSVAINDMLGPASAEAIDAVSVRVQAPKTPGARTSFLSILENIEVEPAP